MDDRYANEYIKVTTKTAETTTEGFLEHSSGMKYDAALDIRTIPSVSDMYVRWLEWLK